MDEKLVFSKEGMTLRQFIDTLLDMARDEPLGDQIEVVALAEGDEPYTPVIAIGPNKDGVRRISVA